MRGKALGPGDENQLWGRLCKGDRVAFDAIYHQYFPQLFQYCIRFTPDRDLIKDVLQDFFFDLFCKPPQPSSIQHLKSYLLVAVRRKLIKILSKETAQYQSLDDQEDSYEFHLQLAVDHDLVAREQDSLRSTAMQRLIDTLTPRQREAVYLYFYENVSYEQIAVIMSLKEVKYARTLVYRALDEMRAIVSRNDALAAFMRP